MINLFNKIKYLQKHTPRQRGAVLMVMLVILIVGGSAMLLNSLNSATARLARDKVTADALTQAKEALIGHATSLVLTSATYPDRPGDLPCPDMNNDGIAEGLCGSAAGSNPQLRLGRLPWKTLGLPDLRDGSGERLWYAVSNNFKKNTRTAILNSDTVGTISVFSSEGILINDGGGSTGAVAAIIAPGEVLTRQDSASPQNRSCTIGVDCDVQEKCTTSPPTLTPKCDPKNYLDIPSVGVNPKDNDKFTDASSTDGFIQGRIKDANDRMILNDQILVITRDNIMQTIQKRVAKEVVIALNKYYCGDTNVNPATGACITAAGNRFYPRPADFTDASCLGNLNLASCNSSTSNSGRIPASITPGWSISSILHGTNTSNWFRENAWREVMFYAVANACTSLTPNCTGLGYLTLNNPPSAALINQKVVVIATGSANSAQLHSTGNKNTISNYLENENQTPFDDIFTKKAASPFNDFAISIP